MLAEYIRSFSVLTTLDIVELDRRSPLISLLQSAKSYRRTFFDPSVTRGFEAADGAEMQDITQLTLPSDSVDLMVSSEVLEHVPDLEAAFREMARVLKPGGSHVFTVPPAKETKRLAYLEGGKVHHLVLPPEYHGDNNAQNGILAFWHLGPDFARHIDVAGLDVRIVKGPEGRDRRVVWRATKPA